MIIEDNIKEKLKFLLESMEIAFNGITITEEKDPKGLYRINIESEEPSLLIGHHGETIGAIQHILKVFLWKNNQEDFNIIVDVDNYRQRQEESVMNLIRRKIDAVRETNKEQTLPPMSPYFRRFVHLYIADQGDLASESAGEGDHRYVIIRPK